jgi:hypothetical protein
MIRKKLFRSRRTFEFAAENPADYGGCLQRKEPPSMRTHPVDIIALFTPVKKCESG